MTNAEQFANTLSGATSLASAMTDTTGTALTVTSAGSLPATGQFRIRCQTEMMLATARSGTTLTVQRGIEGTTAATHPSGAVVNHPVTAGSLVQASRARGRFPASDGFTTPDLSAYSWFNQGTATLTTQTGGSVTLADPAHTGENIRMYLRTPPAVPYTLTAYFQRNLPNVEYLYTGLGWYNNTSTKAHFCFVRWHSTFTKAACCPMYVLLASPTSFSNQYQIAQCPYSDPWIQISDNGTSRIMRVSRDGVNFVTISTQSNTLDLTTTHVGIMFGVNNSTYNYSSSLLSFNQT